MYRRPRELSRTMLFINPFTPLVSILLLWGFLFSMGAHGCPPLWTPGWGKIVFFRTKRSLFSACDMNASWSSPISKCFKMDNLPLHCIGLALHRHHVGSDGSHLLACAQVELLLQDQARRPGLLLQARELRLVLLWSFAATRFLLNFTNHVRFLLRQLKALMSSN